MGRVVHFEISADDVARAREFYKIFGWEATDAGMPGMEYWLMKTGDGELGIALRTGQITGKEIRIYAGCGIVAGSNPEKELEESAAKMIPMKSALQS